MLRMNMILNWLLHLGNIVITNKLTTMKSKTRLRDGQDRLTGIKYSKCPRKTFKQRGRVEIDEDLDLDEFLRKIEKLN